VLRSCKNVSKEGKYREQAPLNLRDKLPISKHISNPQIERKIAHGFRKSYMLSHSVVLGRSS